MGHQLLGNSRKVLWADRMVLTDQMKRGNRKVGPRSGLDIHQRASKVDQKATKG